MMKLSTEMSATPKYPTRAIPEMTMYSGAPSTAMITKSPEKSIGELLTILRAKASRPWSAAPGSRTAMSTMKVTRATAATTTPTP